MKIYNLLSFTLIVLCLVGCVSEPGPPIDTAELDASIEAVSTEWNGTMIYNHPDNPFHQEIPDEYEVHPNSTEMIDLIKSITGDNYTNTFLSTGDYSIPVYIASDTTATRNIEFYLYGKPPGKTHMLNVPFVQGSQPAKGGDSHYTVIQKDSRCVYEFWLFDYNKAGGGNAISLDDSGIYQDGRASVAAGWSNLQGIIWPSELKEGEIKHALSFSVPVTNANGHVPPATKNDGALSNNEYAIPEGARIRIKPEINIDTIQNIGSVERTVYKAIQKYGMFCGDTNGAGISIRTIAPMSANADAFPDDFDVSSNLGLHYLKSFPLDYLEVINFGEIIPSEVKDYVDHGCSEWN
ncbi:hypothetical protein N9231_02470 [Saprospiraceae bacterium]|nr:hypothetical protein [Saprospiraceae bacterium]